MRWSTKCARRGLGYVGLRGLPAGRGGEQRRVSRENRWRRHGVDAAARTRARGIAGPANAGGRRVEEGAGFSLFCGSYLPGSSLSNPGWPVGTLCQHLSFSLSALLCRCLVLLLSWRRFVHSFVFVFAPPRSTFHLPSLSRTRCSYTYHRSLFFSASSLSFSLSLSLLLLFFSPFVHLFLSAYMYAYNITHSLAPREQQRQYNI